MFQVSAGNPSEERNSRSPFDARQTYEHPRNPMCHSAIMRTLGTPIRSSSSIRCTVHRQWENSQKAEAYLLSLLDLTFLILSSQRFNLLQKYSTLESGHLERVIKLPSETSQGTMATTNGTTNGGTMSKKTNGHTPVSQAWLGLAQCLPPRDPDTEFWWQTTGGQLATLLEAAGYSVERQYEVLVFHHQWVVSDAPCTLLSITTPTDISQGSIPGPRSKGRKYETQVEILDHPRWFAN